VVTEAWPIKSVTCIKDDGGTGNIAAEPVARKVENQIFRESGGVTPTALIRKVAP
jgi:hypothetical protein